MFCVVAELLAVGVERFSDHFRDVARADLASAELCIVELAAAR